MQTYRHARSLLLASFLLLIGVPPVPAAGQAAPAPQAQVQAPAKDTVAGVRNFTKVDATIACGGALAADSVQALKQAGFASIVNLRTEAEPGANIEAEQKAAKDAGLKYFHVPFSAAEPDAAKLDEFLELVAARENQPMLLHCASGARASMFWAVKRVMVDGWPVEKAMSELPNLAKNVPEPTRAFFLDYLKAHGKVRP